ncbi:MAG TPA: carboxypeptidase-like regulatory domain-containing protein [Terriglobia bacterium]|nr:carboxypeptidase-like regulatory domain-containing protein [Terriglobia bacterium]
MIMPVVGASLFLLLQAPPARGTIEGVVLNISTGKPVSGAQVTIMRVPNFGTGAVTTGIMTTANGPGFTSQSFSPGGLPAAPTDNNGRFVFQDLEPGPYRMTALANGYAQQEYGARAPGQSASGTSIDLTAGQAIKDVVFRMTPAGNVSGRVTGPTGEPVVGTEVLLLRSVYDPNGRKNYQQTGVMQTNDRGEYRFFWVPPGRYYLNAGSPSRPQPGLNAFVPMTVGNKYARVFYPGTADPSAAVAIDIQPAAETGGIDFHLAEQQTYRVRGRVIDSRSGQPAAPQNSSISIIPRDVGIAGMGTFSSSAPYNGADGSFELRDIPSGSYWIRAQLPMTGGFQPGGPPPRPPMGIAAVDVRNADVDGVVVNVTPGISLSGRMSVEGAALPPDSGFERTNITFRSSVLVSLTAPPPPVRPNADGIFQIQNTFPGEYQLIVGTPPNVYLKEARWGSIDILSRPLEITGPVSNELQIVLGQNPGQIGGTVMDERQQTVPNAQVVLIPNRRERNDLYRPATTDASGHFTMRTIPPGDYKIFAWENIERNSFFDPDVLRQFEQKGKPVIVGESSNATVDVTVIH